MIWSGWEGDQNGAQNIYIARLTNPWTVEGPRARISRPAFPWEKVGDMDQPNLADNPAQSMNLNEFRKSLSGDAPPQGLSLALAGLWWDAKGDWAKAHETAQQDEGPAGAWAHAYLHRKKGDLSNAAYWYHRARRPVPTGPLPEEWNAVVMSMLG
jgi:hypothetical protein